MGTHPRTREFVQRQRDRGRSTPEILRILKRAIARELFKQLSRPSAVLGIDDLRATRQAKNITLHAAATGLASHAMTISRMERGLYLNTELATRYRAWLTAA
jgi:transposase